MAFSNIPVLNDAGQTAFKARLIGSSVDSTNDFGLWSEGSGSLVLVAREGSQAPGVPSGVNFNLFVGYFAPALNNAGQTAFKASLIGDGVVSTNNEGIWSEGSAGLALVARAGDHAPGTPSGVNFGSSSGSFSEAVLNDAGQTAFRANLTGSGVDSTNSRGIWSEGSGSLALVARAGDHAPGTPSDVKFSSFGVDFVLNDAGQIAFEADTSGGSQPGIWATDRNGVLQLIARRGGLLEIAPGDFRTVNFLELDLRITGNSDGRPSWFNNRGQLVFIAGFTDGTSGIFVSNRVAVPEPSSLLLGALANMGLVSLATRRGRRQR
ncbi:MAG: hypothetical protein SH868_13225 [Bythopirellula sp.]|nr:hypothetical protein [Bythopirellula sp.]